MLPKLELTPGERRKVAITIAFIAVSSIYKYDDFAKAGSAEKAFLLLSTAGAALISPWVVRAFRQYHRGIGCVLLFNAALSALLGILRWHAGSPLFWVDLLVLAICTSGAWEFLRNPEPLPAQRERSV